MPAFSMMRGVVGPRVRVWAVLEMAGAGEAPGAAGTVQEIFQDACENYYAMPEEVAPMILLGRDYWTRTLPVWPLLEALAARPAYVSGREEPRRMAERIHLADSIDEVVELLGR